MSTNDLAEAAEAMARKHGGWWREHPAWPLAKWCDEVVNDETRMGYWAWVVARIAEEGGQDDS